MMPMSSYSPGADILYASSGYDNPPTGTDLSYSPGGSTAAALPPRTTFDLDISTQRTPRMHLNF